MDVKKAFNSANHNYLISVIKSLNLPKWCEMFLSDIVSRWNLNIRYKNEDVIKKKVEKGILQGDHLSPLLFVLCMDPLSRKLNTNFPKVEMKLEEETYTSNHLLFIDDLKIFCQDDSSLKIMVDETEKFFTSIGLELNIEKSVTNSKICSDKALVLDADKGYKYLGIVENRDSSVSKLTYDKLKKEILASVEKLANTKLNGKNTIKATNKYLISMINYYVGVVSIDHDIRKILAIHTNHYQRASKEKLYLPRDEMGRGLVNVPFKSEKMQLELHRNLENSKQTSLRRDTYSRL